MRRAFHTSAGSSLRTQAPRALSLALLLLGAPGLGLAQINPGDVVVTDRLRDALIHIDTSGAPNATQTVLDTGGALDGPRGLGVDGDGFLYVTARNGTVWRVRSDPGGGTQTLIRFGLPLIVPRGIVVAPSAGGLATNGVLYVAENPAGAVPGTIWEIDPVTGAIDVASAAGFLTQPTGIAREEAGTLIVANGSTLSFNGVFRIDPEAFDPINSSANQQIVSERGMLVFPQRPALLTEAGETRAVFVTDLGGTPLGSSETFDPQVVCIDASVPFDPFDPKANQTLVSGGGLIEIPIGIVIEDVGIPGDVDSGMLLVADAGAEAIIRIPFTPDAGGAPCPAPGSAPTILTDRGQLDLPWDLQIVPQPNPFQGQPFYISDTSDSGGAVYFVEPATPPDTGTRTEIVAGNFDNPTGLALDLDGNLIVLDAGDGSVHRVLDPDPRSGNPTLEMPALATGLGNPTGVAIDSEGHILVVDRDAGEIWRIRPDEAPMILIARRDDSDPGEPLINPVAATLGVDGQLIVVDAGDPGAGDVPRLVQVDPATGFRQVIAFPIPSLPPLAGIARDLDGSNLVTGDGSEAETLVRQNLPIGSPTYITESDDSVFVRPRGLDIDANRSVLVVDAGDGDTGTQDGVVRRVDTLLPADATPPIVATGASDTFFDPYDIELAISRDPPVLDLDGDDVPDGSDNCSTTQNPPSVCSGGSPRQRTPCAPNDDECFSRGQGSCGVNVCSEDLSLSCADDTDCDFDFGPCLVSAVCSGDQTTACVTSSQCDDAGLGSCIQNLCALDTTLGCAEDQDCQPNFGTCLISACTGDGSSCNPDLGSCEQANMGSCIQLDEDEDGVGNACDNCFLLDNAPADNPQFPQLDEDGDALGDACDPCDANGNGVSDAADLAAIQLVLGGTPVLNGACTLDNVGCNDDTDCAAPSCVGGFCSPGGTACVDDTTCPQNLCGLSPADCDGDGDVDVDDETTVMGQTNGTLVGPGFDFDEDFIADQTDICPDAFDPSVCLDGSLCDIPEFGPSPCQDGSVCAQPDTDGDGIGNACNDIEDFDLDEIADDFDSCPVDVNGKLCSLFGTPCRVDSDCNGFSQTCIQPDNDADTIGNACDTCASSDILSCSISAKQCSDDTDCAQTCDDNLCSMDGLACNVPADCAALEVCEFLPDLDGDFIQNSCDTCPLVSNPRICSESMPLLSCRFDSDCPEEGETCLPQLDQDSDGMGDACDDDLDGDGEPNVSDNCPFDANDQTDTDGDEIGDVCDSCPNGPAMDPDSDGDLIQDSCDSCPNDLNPRLCAGTNIACIIDADCPGAAFDSCEVQPDEDGDGAGDRCDSCPSDADPHTCSTDGMPCLQDTDCSGSQTCGPPDDDADGVGNACDACPGSPELMRCTNDPNVTCDDDADCILETTGLCVFAPDLDGDNIQNSCDLCPFDADPWVCENDSSIECRLPKDCPSQGACIPRNADGNLVEPDVVPDACDNCKDRGNPGQEDATADGIGDMCDPDFTNDGKVNTPDFVALSIAFGTETGDAEFDPEIDTTGDGKIGADEFIELSIRFGSQSIDWGLAGCDGTLPVPVGCNPPAQP